MENCKIAHIWTSRWKKWFTIKSGDVWGRCSGISADIWGYCGEYISYIGTTSNVIFGFDWNWDIAIGWGVPIFREIHIVKVLVTLEKWNGHDHWNIDHYWIWQIDHYWMANAEHGSKSHVVGMVIFNAFRPTHSSAKSPRDLKMNPKMIQTQEKTSFKWKWNSWAFSRWKIVVENPEIQWSLDQKSHRFPCGSPKVHLHLSILLRSRQNCLGPTPHSFPSLRIDQSQPLGPRPDLQLSSCEECQWSIWANYNNSLTWIVRP